MAEFVASPIVSAGSDPNQFDLSQTNSLANLGAQQNLANQSAYRSSTAGLLAGDPGATATALGANPTATQNYLNSLPAAGQNQRAQAAANMSANGAAAGAVLNAPPEQRQAVWASAHSNLTAAGYTPLAGPDYPGDATMLSLRAQALSPQEQFTQQSQIPTTNPAANGLGGVPGGGSVGPGGSSPGTPAGSGITSAPLPPLTQNSAPGGTGQTQLTNPALAQAESSGNPGVVNKQGFAGLYQFGVPRLMSLGMYTPAQGENPQANTWQGTLNIPGFPQVKTLQDFLANPTAQEAAYQVHQNDIDSAIAATPGASAFDRNGLIAVAHLGGVGGMQKFVASGGQFNPNDPNGTTLAAYYKRFSGGGAPVQTAQNTPQGGAPTATDATQVPAANGPVNSLMERLNQLRNSPPPAQSAAPAVPGHSPNNIIVGGGAGAQPPAPADDTSVAVDNPALAASLPAGTAYRAPGGATGISGQPAPGSAVSPQQAVQQATKDLGNSLNTMSPEDANAAVLQRARQIMSGPTTLPVGLGAAPITGGAPAGTVVPPTPPGMLPSSSSPNLLSSVGADAAGTSTNTLSPLLASTSAQTPTQPNMLSGIGQPPAGTPGAPAMPQSSGAPGGAVPAGIPPGVTPLFVNGRYMPAAQAGYVLGQDAQGNRVAFREPGTVPQLHFENVGGTLIGSDPNTGTIVSRQYIGNTGRLTAVDDGQGGKLLYDPQGHVVSNTPSNTGQALQMEDYKRDQTLAQSAAKELNQAKQTDFAIREQRGITSNLTQTGAFGERKAALANYLESTFSPATAKAFESAAGLDDASQSQLFAKTAIQASGQQENANVGARGGFGLTNLYLKANPGLATQPDAIREVQNLQAVSNLSQQDYLQGLLGHINSNSNSFRSGGQYSPATNFSQQWNGGNNPQVYVAAAEALNQAPYGKWSAGLSDSDKQRALSIAARADNTAKYNGPSGPAALTPYGAPQRPGATTQASAGPSPGAVAYLRQNPALAVQFDQKYGQGAARAALQP